MGPVAYKFLLVGLLSSFALAAGGCASVTPVKGAPIAVEIPSHSNFTVQHTYAYYYDGTLVVEGTLALSPNTYFSQTAHFDVRVLDATGQTLAEAPARIERDEPHRPRALSLGASFKARMKIPLSQVARIEATFSREPKT